jgi:hypothetical protein
MERKKYSFTEKVDNNRKEVFAGNTENHDQVKEK